jgi:type 1 fimbria pilin
MKFVKALTALTLALSLGVSSSASAASTENFDVQIVKGSNINLVSQDSRVPILVRNNYDTEVRVLIHVATSNLRVRLPKVTAVTIPANSTVNATVPVQAVANGNVTLNVWLTSFSGVRLGDNTRISMNVLGNFEAIAIGSLSAVVAALLVFGTLRMLRRRRIQA